MFALRRYPVLATILKPFCRKQKNSLGLVTSAIIEVNSARSADIAALLARWLKILFNSALNRLYRLLRNHKIDYVLLTKQLLKLVARCMRDKLLIAIDWTEWHNELRMLTASVVADKRAIPVQTAAFHRSDIPRSQNSRENGFLNTLAMVLGELGLKAIILCDRGFRRVSWLKLLQDRKLDFVIRLKEDVYAHAPGIGTRLLSNMGLRPGRVIDLKWVMLREDQAVRVRVIGVWSRKARERWWLATSLNCSAERVVAYYDRRMAIEEQLRDTKGCRFGVKLYWTQFKKPEHLAHLSSLVGIAILVWTAIGRAAALANPSLRFKHPKKGPRYSYVTIGVRSKEEVLPNIPMTAKNVEALIPKPTLRNFPWISLCTETI